MVSLPGFLQGVDDSHELLGGMRDSDVVVLALGALLGKIRGEDRVPDADIFRGIEDGVAKVARSTFLHMRVSTGSFQIPGFVSGW